MAEARYPRDLHGYGRNPPDPHWPSGARVAVQFVINFEEGGENNILHGDRASEAFLSDVLGAQPWPGQRHANTESMFEYGSRAGFWRLWRMFTERKLPTTVFGVATALKRNPEVVAAMKEAGWDIASHSLKWVEHKDMSEAEERLEIADAIRVHTEATGQRPLGWYTGRSSINTARPSGATHRRACASRKRRSPTTRAGGHRSRWLAEERGQVLLAKEAFHQKRWARTQSVALILALLGESSMLQRLQRSVRRGLVEPTCLDHVA